MQNVAKQTNSGPLGQWLVRSSQTGKSREGIQGANAGRAGLHTMTTGGLRPNANLHATVYVWMASSRVGTRIRHSGDATLTPRSRFSSSCCCRCATTSSDRIGIRYAAYSGTSDYLTETTTTSISKPPNQRSSTLLTTVVLVLSSLRLHFISNRAVPRMVEQSKA